MSYTRIIKDVINTSFNVEKVLEFINFEESSIIGFDTETTNKAMPYLVDFYKLDVNKRIEAEPFIAQVKAHYMNKDTDKNAVIELWNGLLASQGCDLIGDKFGIPQIRKAFKALNNALNPRDCFVSCVQFGTYNKIEDEYKVVLIQINEHTNGSVIELLNHLKTKSLVIHNAEFDVKHVYQSFGVFLDGILIDTKIASSLAKGCRNWKSLSLKNMCRSLGINDRLAKKDENPLEVMWDKTHNMELLEYAVQDVTAVLELWGKLKPLIVLEGVQDACMNEFKAAGRIALPSVSGICLDQAVIESQIAHYEEEKRRLLSMLPDDFPTISEKSNVLTWINNYFGITLTSIEKKTIQGDKSLKDNTALMDMMDIVIKASSCETQKSYLLKMRGKEKDYPVFTSVVTRENEFGGGATGGTVTGRMTAGIHITPKERRKAYVPKEGHVFLCADYNAIQFWITAEYSKDPTMYSLIEQGIDPHTYLASIIYKNPDMLHKTKAELTKEETTQRQLSKMGNFGFIFGLWHTSFAKKTYAETRGEIDLSDDEAKTIRDGFFNTFNTIETWQQGMFIQGVLYGYCETAAGRKRYWDKHACLKARDFKAKQGWYVPDLSPVVINGVRYNDYDMMLRYTDWDWKNVCINTPIQGTEAEGVKTAIALLPSWLEQKIWHHDSIVVECPIERVEEGVQVLDDCMVRGMRKYCPTTKVEVEIEVANHWR